DGRLFTCLFASAGSDLRAALGQGEDALTERIASLWGTRGDRYSELRDTGRRKSKKIEMFFIGG
ncbi:MAG: GTP 3',8-cyclase MoaA, partial [Arenimonas sp.]